MKEERIITRENGSQVKIVAELFTGPNRGSSIGNYVLHRPSDIDDWELCKTSSDVKTDSVDEYIQFGRPEIFNYASISEILKTNQMLTNRLNA